MYLYISTYTYGKSTTIDSEMLYLIKIKWLRKYNMDNGLNLSKFNNQMFKKKSGAGRGKN